MKPYKIVCFTSRYRALAARINEVSEGIAEMIRWFGKSPDQLFSLDVCQCVLMTPSFNVQFHVDTDLFISHKDENIKMDFANPK